MGMDKNRKSQSNKCKYTQLSEHNSWEFMCENKKEDRQRSKYHFYLRNAIVLISGMGPKLRMAADE